MNCGDVGTDVAGCLSGDRHHMRVVVENCKFHLHDGVVRPRRGHGWAGLVTRHDVVPAAELWRAAVLSNHITLELVSMPGGRLQYGAP